MDRKDRKLHLTNELVKKKFVSQFDLVNYAIKLAVNMIHTGREGRVKIDSHNHATQILSEIISGKDHFENVISKEKEVSAPHVPAAKDFEEDVKTTRRKKVKT